MAAQACLRCFATLSRTTHQQPVAVTCSAAAPAAPPLPRGTTPDAKLIKVAPTEVGGKRFVRFEATQIAGVYDLQDAKGKPIASFSVSQASAESDLRTLDPEEAARYSAVLDSPISGTPAELKRDLWRSNDGTEAAVWLFVAAILIFFLDAALTRVWFS